MRRVTHVLAYTSLLGVIAVWLMVPQLGLTATVRSWLAIFLASARSIYLSSAPGLPTSLTAPAGTVLTATFAVVLPRVAMIAWRSYSFVRKRRKAALRRAATALI